MSQWHHSLQIFVDFCSFAPRINEAQGLSHSGRDFAINWRVSGAQQVRRQRGWKESGRGSWSHCFLAEPEIGGLSHGGGGINGGTRIAGRFIRDDPINMDDLGYPLLWKPSRLAVQSLG